MIFFQKKLSQNNIDCYSCEAGKYLNFNYKNNSFECLNCPINTYSTGGNFRINGKYNEWNDEVISNFNKECFVSDGNSENHYCTSFYNSDYDSLKRGNAFSFEKLNYTYVA